MTNLIMRVRVPHDGDRVFHPTAVLGLVGQTMHLTPNPLSPDAVAQSTVRQAATDLDGSLLLVLATPEDRARAVLDVFDHPRPTDPPAGVGLAFKAKAMTDAAYFGVEVHAYYPAPAEPRAVRLFEARWPSWAAPPDVAETRLRTATDEAVVDAATRSAARWSGTLDRLAAAEVPDCTCAMTEASFRTCPSPRGGVDRGDPRSVGGPPTGRVAGVHRTIGLPAVSRRRDTKPVRPRYVCPHCKRSIAVTFNGTSTATFRPHVEEPGKPCPKSGRPARRPL